MNDDELDRLVAATAPVRDSQIAGLDLRDSEEDFLEEIMATTTTRVSLGDPSPDGPGGPRRNRLRVTLAIGAVAAAVLAIVLVATRDRHDVVTDPSTKHPTTLPTTVPAAITTDPIVALPPLDIYKVDSVSQTVTDAGGTAYEVDYRLKNPGADDYSSYSITTTTDPDGSVWGGTGDTGGPGDGPKIRGHETFTDGTAGTMYYNWQEKSGVVVTLGHGSDGAGPEDFDAFVARLRPATPAEWQALLRDHGR